MKLYTYWRSTAAYRVRIALNLKGLDYDMQSVHLVKDGGQQHEPAYTRLNPSHLVPTLVLEDGTALTQSLAIIGYLDAVHPDPALLPADPAARAQVTAAAHVIAMDIHPLNNTRVLGRLTAQFAASPGDRTDWMLHWMNKGFAALEVMVRENTKYAFADTPGLADICIVAQYYNARRWGLDLTRYPRLTQIEQTCLTLPAFADARPEAQPDAE